MKLMKWLGKTLVCGVGLLAVGTPHAVAATPYWANAENYRYSKPVTVRWCSGGTGVLDGGEKTSKNICGILMRDDRELYVSVKETGTVLVDRYTCSGDKWISFTTSTDTSRTAEIIYQWAGCA